VIPDPFGPVAERISRHAAYVVAILLLSEVFGCPTVAACVAVVVYIERKATVS